MNKITCLQILQICMLLTYLLYGAESFLRS